MSTPDDPELIETIDDETVSIDADGVEWAGDLTNDASLLGEQDPPDVALNLGDAAPEPAPVVSLDAVSDVIPVPAAQASSLDLPELELPHNPPVAVAPPEPRAATWPSAPPAPLPPQQYQQYSPATTLNPSDESTWATAAHWSALVAGFVSGGSLGFLGPLLIMLLQGPKSARVRANAVESLNFEITYLIAMIASVVLILAVIGIVGLVVFPVLWLILRIVASVQTAGGRDYRYPLNIRLVK